MSSFRGILTGFKEDWAAGGFTAFMPAANIYYDRAAQPESYAGFPYAELFVNEIEKEICAPQGGGANLITYELEIRAYSVQGQTGGADSGDGVTNCYNLQVGLESILADIPPNAAWHDVPGFLHCIPAAGGAVAKDELLYDGRDVYVSINKWHLLIGEYWQPKATSHRPPWWAASRIKISRARPGRATRLPRRLFLVPSPRPRRTRPAAATRITRAQARPCWC